MTSVPQTIQREQGFTPDHVESQSSEPNQGAPAESAGRPLAEGLCVLDDAEAEVLKQRGCNEGKVAVPGGDQHSAEIFQWDLCQPHRKAHDFAVFLFGVDVAA